MKRKRLFRKNLKRKGSKYQWRKLQEECNELSVAISHFINRKKGSEKELYEEFAHVKICLMHLEPTLDKRKLDAEMFKKLNQIHMKVKENSKNE